MGGPAGQLYRHMSGMKDTDHWPVYKQLKDFVLIGRSEHVFRLAALNGTNHTGLSVLCQAHTIIMSMCMIVHSHTFCAADTKNVAVYQCKANYTGDGEGNELTINKGDHVNVLEKSDGGMCSDDTSKCR